MSETTLEHYSVLIADDERAVLDAYRTVLSDINPPAVSGNLIESLEAKLFGQAPAVPAGPTFCGMFCGGGEEAVDALRSAGAGGPPTPVAFLDVRMPPGIDGIETAARLRALDPEINIVIVTAYADSHPREIALRVPPLDKLFYISKPFQKLELQQFVLALTAKWKAERYLRFANSDLTQRCRDLEAAQTELVQARQRAELANKAKSDFVANMSHELRTPLNAVIGFADVMRSELYGPVGDARYRKYLDDISHSGVHLLRMINDLLDFAKIEAGKLSVDIEDIDPEDVLDSAMSLVRLQAEQAGVALHKENTVVRQQLRADGHRLRQVVLNLLSNAIKFTPKSGRVTVSSSINADRSISLSVSDTGVGMTPAEIQMALEPFGQIEHTYARNYQGTGLGLTIAKKLTELQGGTLEIASAHGRGTIVSVRFPADRVVIRPERQRVTQH